MELSIAKRRAKKQQTMCTITLSYDQDNAVARRKLSELLKSGLFKQTDSAVELELSELERRMDAYKNGEMSTVPQDEIRNRVMAEI